MKHLKHLLPFFLLFALTACGQKAPKAISASVIQKELQTFYYDKKLKLQELDVKKIDVLSFENTGSETAPVYDVRIKINVSLPFDSHLLAYEYGDKKIVRLVAKKGAKAEKQFVIRVLQKSSGEWNYRFAHHDRKIDYGYYHDIFGYPLTHKGWENALVFNTKEEKAFREKTTAELNQKIKEATDSSDPFASWRYGDVLKAIEAAVEAASE